MQQRVFDYLNPTIPADLRIDDVPLIDATEATLAGYGEIVRDPYRHRIEIWHEATFPIAPSGRFFDKQGKVHARVSVDLAGEFGVLLAVPLTPP